MPDSGQPDTNLRERAQEYLLRQRAQHYLGFQGREPPESVPPEIPAIQQQGGHRLEKQAAAMGAGAMVGGLLFPGVVAAPVAEYAGGYLGGVLSGVPPAEAAKGAAVGAVAGAAGGLLSYGATRAAGRMGGFTPEAVKAGLRDPSLLSEPLTYSEASTPASGRQRFLRMTKDRGDAELNLARQLQANTEIQGGHVTPGHEAYQQEFLGPLKHATLDVQPYVDALRSQVTGGDHPAMRMADRAVNSMAERLQARAALSGGRMTAGDLDSWIRGNLTDPLGGAYARGSEAVVAKRLMAARAAMSERLYASLGPGASSAQKLGHTVLTTREAVEARFGLGTEAKPSAKGAQAIFNIRSQTGDAQLNRDLLARYDAEYGTDYLRKAQNLSMRRELTGQSAADVYAIDSILRPERPGFIRGVSRSLAKGGMRAQPFAGPLSAGGAATLWEQYVKRHKQSANSVEVNPPESTFQGMTNKMDNQ